MAPVASTPRRVSHRSGHSNSGASSGDGDTNAGPAGASSSVHSSASRRSTSGGNSTNNNAGGDGLEDGYSSHGSRQSSKDCFNEDDIDDEADSGSDASGKGLMLDMMGLRTTSSDTSGALGGDEESTTGTGGTLSPRPHPVSVLRHVSGAGASGSAGADSSGLRVPTTRKEWLEQFCSTPMRDPVSAPAPVRSPSSSSSPLPGEGGSLSPAGAVAQQTPAVSAIMKAWAAVGRIDGGSGQLLGQVINK